MRLQLAGLQLNSKLKCFASNAARAEKLLENFKASEYSLVVLPELALTGYGFESPTEIEPYLEYRNGPSVQWAQATATTINSHIIIGFPEISDGKIYNTAALVAPDQSVLAFYRKTHLYFQDKMWGCTPSPEKFKCVGPFKTLPINLQIGICMDLNPWEFQAPFDDLEFASSCRENMAQLAVLPMAWLASEPAPAKANTDYELVNYWLSRQPSPIPTLFANRCGLERGVLYGGSSTIKHSDGSSISSNLGEEGLISTMVDIPRAAGLSTSHS